MKLDRSLYAWFLLILLSVIWGISPMLIKKSLISLHPLEIGALRLSFAAIILLPFLAKNIKEVKKKDFLILFISGIVGNVIPYFLYPIAQTKIDSGTSGVLTSLTPFFALIIGVLFYNQKATKNNLIGLTIGFLGTVALILFSNNSRGFGSDVFGLFVVLATFLYGINLNLVKHHLNHLKPITIASFSIVSILPITLYMLLDRTAGGFRERSPPGTPSRRDARTNRRRRRPPEAGSTDPPVRSPSEIRAPGHACPRWPPLRGPRRAFPASSWHAPGHLAPEPGG